MNRSMAVGNAALDAFRRYGYLQADLDPLRCLQPQPHPELDADGEEADIARRYYCGTIGVEFMHIPDVERRQWIIERIEAEAPGTNSARVLEQLIRADILEQVLQVHYVGTKRFSLEGLTALVPFLCEALDRAAEAGTEQAVIGMSHRGRLNLMVHIVGKSPAEVFAKFEDVDPRSVLGGGDVKYHLGATGEYRTARGRTVGIHLVSNPSHLEAVDPVALGRVRAKQTRLGPEGRYQVLPILIHGDAAFAGEGIAAETLNLAGLRGYSVGGVLHIIANNLIGFTTNADELHTSRFASDLAKRLPIPILHVNAEDADAVVRVAQLALEYRHKFLNSVVVDLIGYRRHGHSEIDDPTTTQPVRYRKISELLPLWLSYAKRIQVDPAETVKRVRAEYEEGLAKARGMKKDPRLYQLPDYWSSFKGGSDNPADEVETALPSQELHGLAQALTSYPGDFSIHPKVKRLLEQRRQMGCGDHPVDFAMAEALAFGSLVKQGVPVRLSGQDTARGTFNQRHAVLIDTKTEKQYVPLCHVAPNQAKFEVYNSSLAEAAPLGFEYGFSRDYPEALVLWEAQFGDFSNGAQVIIDQFVVAAENKWGLLSGLVLLLPHGYEAQGPEHSSARMERFLQLAARDNIQVCQPSTAAQYYHLLRRQALRAWRKPLIVFTPKGMLRNPRAASGLETFSKGAFQPVIPDTEVERAQRIIVATGKILHELRAERRKSDRRQTAIVALEQIYPFPEEMLAAEVKRHDTAREILWVQEEPANMGALMFVFLRLKRLAGGRLIRTVKRSRSSSPATGSAKAYKLEQEALINFAFAAFED